ncbi:MAG: leucyl aminopeptidase [Actinobacteria bacterium]|nr:MAG: leucyl aminopeptidase [Actinomycetota bacterium]
MSESLPTLGLADGDPAEQAVDAVVIGVYSQDADAPAPLLLASGAESIAAAFEGRLVQTLALLGASGAAGEVTKLATLGTISAPLVVAVGLGPEPAGALPATDVLRRAAGVAARALAGTGTALFALPVADDPEREPEAVRALAEGALLGAYQFAGYKTKGNGRRPALRSATMHVPDAKDRAVKAETKRASTVVRAVARTRDWVNTAPNELRPPDFADAVAAAGTAAGLSVEVLDEKALKRGGYGGILAVGMGSTAPPRLVRLAYAPRGAVQHLALIGKGITFDTGGYAVKPASGMWEMKGDMAGAAAVASVLLAVAALKPKLAVTGYLPMAENMISGSAYRPGDVVTMYNGLKVEVLNPDAEGRMVLADAMARACEDEPDYLLETSTLTGGQVVALGKRIAGVMGDEDFCQWVKEAGDAAGEPAWPMPLPDDVRKGMDSDVADISQTNANMDRAGHMLQGGIFLSQFVTADLPWAHLDIAGPSYHSGEPTGYWSKGGTGVPVRTVLELIDRLTQPGSAARLRRSL